MLFNIFINDVDIGIKCTFSKLADGIRMNGAVNTIEEKEAIQRDVDNKKWAQKNLTRFNKVKRTWVGAIPDACSE